ncbi:MAG: alanine--tRNA ligase [Planctomycetota bacterium]
MPPAPTTSTAVRADEVRQRFIQFFKDRGHDFVPSSPVVPHDDPTLLFTNAGMNQYKPVFLGNVAPTSPLAGLKRAANSQKCIRAGGKHNDLDDVGKDGYHHTFFEMLGNWSFGDYFKKEAIDWAWELLTKVYGIPEDRLYATYFGGDRQREMEADLEAKELWLRYLPESRVLPGSFKDNFWEMGDTGPCGPCSEIHFDRIGGRDASKLVNMDDENVIECWNLVFIQYDRQPSGDLRALPAKHVDTGMGLERLVSVLKGLEAGKPVSNYDTDLFSPLFDRIAGVTKSRPYSGKFGAADTDGIDTAYRVLADHARTLTFSIADGAVPSNEGRGYVLRRILRRAVRFGRQNLGAPAGFFTEIIPTVMETMGGHFPELRADPKRVLDLIAEEEESFGKTLDRGIKLFDEIATNADNKTIAGPDAFKLYDTYGFPIDLTSIMAEERGLAVDIEGFEREMLAQKERSRQGAKGSGDADSLVLDAEAVATLEKMNIDKTFDAPKFSIKEHSGTVRAIWNGRNFDENAESTRSRPVGVVLDETSFYAEMGGQVGDTGRFSVTREASAGSNFGGGEFRVLDTQTFGGYVLHIGIVAKGEIRVGDTVAARVERPRRLATASNHTATHLLNLGLRKVLGDTVDQKGSLVDPERLRFDFSHNKSVSPDELAKVEDLVIESINADHAVDAKTAPLDKAESINGLRAVFGEAYPDPVRVVAIGAAVDDLLADPDNAKWADLSIEFCGGTHLERTGQAQAFAITAEEAVAKGIRRVNAVTGSAAAGAHAAADTLLDRVRIASKLDEDTLRAEIQALNADLESLTLPAAKAARIRGGVRGLQDKLKAADKEAAKAKAAQAAGLAKELAASAERSTDPAFISTIDAGGDRGALQAAIKTITDRVPKMPVMLLSEDAEGKVAVMAQVPKDAIGKGLKAGDWVRETVTVMGGKGGGRPDSAQGAGSAANIKDAIKAARRFAFDKLN